MPLATGERAFHKLLIGKEATEGTPVAGKFLYPAESASEPDLNRAPNMPNEDYGELANVHRGRSSFGVREATTTIRSEARFEDIMPILEMCVSGGNTPTGSNPYTWAIACDNTADTLISRTIQTGDNINVFQVPGALGTRLRISWQALKPGTASPVQLELTIVGRDKTSIGAFSSSPSVQSAPETMMGHFARLYYGPVGTAFGSLSEVVGSLVSCDITIETGVLLRKQGGTSDKADAHGRGKIGITYTMVVESKEADREAFWDVFESDTSNPAVPSRRMRIVITGSTMGGANEQQTVTITGAPTGGTFTLTFSAQTTAAIPYNASAGAVQAALAALSTIGDGNVLVTGANGGPYTVTFRGTLGYANQPAMTAAAGGLTPSGGVTIATATEGAAGTAKSFTIDGAVQNTAVPATESDGATRFAIAGQFEKDSSLAAIAEFTVVNAIASMPDA